MASSLESRLGGNTSRRQNRESYMPLLLHGNYFSPDAIPVPGTELGSSSLLAGTFT